MSESSDPKQPENFSHWMSERMESTRRTQEDRERHSDTVQNGVTPDVSGNDPLPDSATVSPPLLNGRLAEYLSTRKRRELPGGTDPITSKQQDYIIGDLQERAATAMALVLASHIVRFAVALVRAD